VRSFFAQGYRACRLGLPFNVIVPDAVRDAWRAGSSFWHEVAMIVRNLERTDTELLVEVTPDLFRIAKWWEFRMLELLWRARVGDDQLAQEDLDLVAACDRHWKHSTWLFPDYEMLPETTARLL
jgi:hypothetical protein